MCVEEFLKVILRRPIILLLRKTQVTTMSLSKNNFVIPRTIVKIVIELTFFLEDFLVFE